MNMYQLYSVPFVFGLIQLIQTLAFVCPPSNNKGETETVQFCSDSEVTSNDIYIDSSETSSRVTNCTCNFGITDETIISINSTNSQVYDCKTKIQYGDDQSSLLDVCGKVNLKIDIKTSQTYNLILINGKINLKTYCLRLFTGNTIKIKLKCFPNFHETTNSTTSMFIVENQGLPPHILASVVVGCVLVVITISILTIVCIRHKRRQKSSDPNIDQHIYINQSVVQYNVDGNCDEINAYKRNNSKGGDVEEDIAGGFAKIKSTDVRLQTKPREVGGDYEIIQPLTNAQTNSSNQSDKNIHSLASNSHLDQFQSGVVYSSPVKKLKGTNTHVNALPEKTKIKRSQGVSSVSAEVRKLTKNGKTRSHNIKARNITANKAPQVVAPKPVFAKSDIRLGKRKLNKDGLHYSEIEIHVPGNIPTSKNSFSIDKTVYAEIL